MPKIDFRRRSVPRIGELRERVVICTTVEKPDGNVSTIVNRAGVIRVHGRVRRLRPDQILNYQAVFGTQNTPSVEIVIRAPPDVKVDLNHWVFQETGYAKTWYKVRAVDDLGGVGRFLALDCSIETVNDARNDAATQEPPPQWEEPDKPPIVDRI